MCHLKSVSGFTKVSSPVDCSDRDLIKANASLSFLEKTGFLFCRSRCRFRISCSFFSSSIENSRFFRFEKRMEKSVPSRVISVWIPVLSIYFYYYQTYFNVHSCFVKNLQKNSDRLLSWFHRFRYCYHYCYWMRKKARIKSSGCGKRGYPS